MHQVKILVVGLQIFWKKNFARNRVMSHEDCDPGELIEEKESTKNEIGVSLKAELNKITAQIQNQNEIIEKMKHELEKTGTRQHEGLERRIEHLEQHQMSVS